MIRGLDGIDFVGMDLVEVAPPYDIANVTSLAGATLMLDYLCLRASDLPSKVSAAVHPTSMQAKEVSRRLDHNAAPDC